MKQTSRDRVRINLAYENIPTTTLCRIAGRKEFNHVLKQRLTLTLKKCEVYVEVNEMYKNL